MRRITVVATFMTAVGNSSIMNVWVIKSNGQRGLAKRLTKGKPYQVAGPTADCLVKLKRRYRST